MLISGNESITAKVLLACVYIAFCVIAVVLLVRVAKVTTDRLKESLKKGQVVYRIQDSKDGGF